MIRTKEEIKAISNRNIELGVFQICNTKRWLATGVMEENTIRIWKANTRSFKVIKINNKFIPLHRFLWVEKHGNISPKMNICFKDGDPMNCVIENLELLSDAELAVLNKQKNLNYPEEITEIQKIINQINKTAKKYGKK